MSRRPRPRFSGKCAVCYVDPTTGRRGTNETTQLCRACAADPLNSGWVETWEDTEEGVSARAAGAGLAAAMEQRPRTPSELEAAINELVSRGVDELVVIKDKQDRKRGTRWRNKALSFRAVARMLGCSDRHVRNVVKGQLK